MSKHKVNGHSEDNLDDLVDDKALARKTKTSRAFWRKLRGEGRGPKFYRCGRLVRYRVRNLYAWLEAHAVDFASTPKAEARR